VVSGRGEVAAGWYVPTSYCVMVAIGGGRWEGGREVVVIPSCNSIQLACLGLYR